MRSIFIKFLVAELFVMAAVPLVFSNIADRKLAGVIAGSLFIALGTWIFLEGWRWMQIRRSVTFVAGCFHLFVSSLPLFITRLLNQSPAFEHIEVLGLPGPIFHRVSTGIFLALLVATIFDVVRIWLAERRRAH